MCSNLCSQYPLRTSAVPFLCAYQAIWCTGPPKDHSCWVRALACLRRRGIRGSHRPGLICQEGHRSQAMPGRDTRDATWVDLCVLLKVETRGVGTVFRRSAGTGPRPWNGSSSCSSATGGEIKGCVTKSKTSTQQGCITHNRTTK